MKIKNKLSIILLLALSLIPIQQLQAEVDTQSSKAILNMAYSISITQVPWIGNVPILRYIWWNYNTGTAMSEGTTRIRWKSFADIISHLVFDINRGLPNTGRAKILADFFQEITEYCDDQMFNNGNGSAKLPDHNLAKLLFGLEDNNMSSLPGIELFARQAAAVLRAIANNTDKILTEGFFSNRDSFCHSAGWNLPIYGGFDKNSDPRNTKYYPATILNIISWTLDHNGTISKGNNPANFQANIYNVNKAILKTLLTPHRSINGLQSYAVDALMINQCINHPERMAKMYKDLLMENGATLWQSEIRMHPCAFEPFLYKGGFCNNFGTLNITDLDSLLCHSLASEIFKWMDCKDPGNIYARSVSMLNKFFDKDYKFSDEDNLTTFDAIKDKIPSSDNEKVKYVLCFMALNNLHMEQENGHELFRLVNLIVLPDDNPKSLIIDTGCLDYGNENLKYLRPSCPSYARIQQNNISIKSAVFNARDGKFSSEFIYNPINSGYNLDGKLRKKTNSVKVKYRNVDTKEYVEKDYAITNNSIKVIPTH
jgi:hypothetical protein